MQFIVYRNKIVLCGFKYPVGHSLTAQAYALSLQLLLLPVQGRSHNKLLCHDVGYSLCCGKAPGDDVLFVGRLNDRRLGILFLAALTGIAVVHMLHHYCLGRNKLKSAYHFLAYLRHSFSAYRA